MESKKHEPFVADQSSVLFCLSKEKSAIRGNGFWKFNSSLTKDQNYIIEIKKMISNFCSENESLFNGQLKWDFLKYEVRKFTIRYMKHVAKEKRQQRINLEIQLPKTKETTD